MPSRDTRDGASERRPQAGSGAYRPKGGEPPTGHPPRLSGGTPIPAAWMRRGSGPPCKYLTSSWACKQFALLSDVISIFTSDNNHNCYRPFGLVAFDGDEFPVQRAGRRACGKAGWRC